jgi:hypothetical protein
MLVKDNDINNIIVKINDHFKNNITNRFLRKALLLMEVPQSIWDKLDNLQEKSIYGKVDGFQLQELYEIIIAAATFLHHAKIDIQPRLRNIVSSGSYSGKGGKEPEGDKILRDMAISNFNSNLGIFADMINELYMKAIAIDKEANKNKNKTCMYEKIPELKQVGQYLVDF